MKKLIMDLDGTLWGTEDSYLYSYNKACETLGIPMEKRHGPEYVYSYLGVKLDELVMTMIPEAPDKQLLGRLLLGNVIEYLLKNPVSYSRDVVGLFRKLSEKYEIHIISNCPRPLLQAFYDDFNIKQYVAGDNTIEDSHKAAAIRRITSGYTEKALFLGDAATDYESIENHDVVKFIWASYGYKDCGQYDYCLDELDGLPALLEKIHRKEKILRNEDREVLCHGKSSVTLMHRKDVSYFGFLHIKEKNDLPFLIQSMKQSMKENHAGKKLLGPVDGNSWYSYRLALNEFDFRLYPDCLSDGEVLESFLSSGFKVAERYTSTVSRLNRDVWEKCSGVVLPEVYQCRVVRGKDCMEYLEQIYEVSSSCFSDHVFYSPISLEDFLELYRENLTHVSPVLILILYENKVIGFNFGYPDPEKRFFVEKTIAIHSDHRSPSILKKIIEATSEEIEAQGFDSLLLHFQHEKLKTLQSYFRGQLIRQKEYGVLEYEVSQNEE